MRAYEHRPVYPPQPGGGGGPAAAPPPAPESAPSPPDWNAEPHWEGTPAPSAKRQRTRTGRKSATPPRAASKKKTRQQTQTPPAGEKVLVPYGEKSTSAKGKQPPTLPLPGAASGSTPAAAVSPSAESKPPIWDSLLAPDKKLMMVGLAFALVLLLVLLDQHKKTKQVKKEKAAPAPFPASPQAAGATPAPESETSLNCPVCGADNLATALFCEQCGAKLKASDPTPHLTHLPDTPAAPAPSEEPKGFCPVCGAANQSGSAFCEECGASLETFETDLPETPTPSFEAEEPAPPPFVESASATEPEAPPLVEETEEETTPPPPLTEQNDPFHGMSQAPLPDASVFLGEDDPTGLGLSAPTAGAAEPQAGDVDFDRFQGEVATLFEDSSDSDTPEAPANPDAPTGDIAALLPEQDTLPHEEEITLNVDDLPVQPPPSYLAEMGDPYRVQEQMQAAADAQTMTENLALSQDWSAQEEPLAAPEEAPLADWPAEETAQANWPTEETGESAPPLAETGGEQAGEQVPCPLCGESNPAGSDHCFNCGASMV